MPHSRFDEPIDTDPGVDVTTWRSGRVAIRCTAEWAEWLGGLSVHCDVPAAQILAQAAQRFAEAVGYNRRPPPRIRRSGHWVNPAAVRGEFLDNGDDAPGRGGHGA